MFVKLLKDRVKPLPEPPPRIPGVRVFLAVDTLLDAGCVQWNPRSGACALFSARIIQIGKKKKMFFFLTSARFCSSH